MSDHDFLSLIQAQQLPLPSVLKNIRKAHCIVHGMSHVEESILATLPKLALQQPLLAQERTLETLHAPLKVGVLFSGGQAPGGHNVLVGLYEALVRLHPDSQLIGFKNGPDGLIQNKWELLKASKLQMYYNTGGFDAIGSGRTKIETPTQFSMVAQTVQYHQLHGLVMIGGDDSNTNAAFLADFFLNQQIDTKVVGVPKTIDGDLTSVDIEASFGFDTATKVYSELIGNVARDALSAKKYFHFIKLMGRSASHVTLECALQTHPNLVLIGEEIAYQKTTLSQIVHAVADLMSQRANLGKNYGVALIPEGLIEFIPEIRLLIQELNQGSLSVESQRLLDTFPKAIAEQLQDDRDPHGNVQVSKISTEQLLIELVKQELSQRTSFKGKFSPVHHFFGYEGRCAYPTWFDASYCLALGATAALLISQGYTGYMARVADLARPAEQWVVGGVPLTSLMHVEERKGKMKPVVRKSFVSLQGEAFRYFASQRHRWGIEDLYRYPGPIQYFGPPQVTQVRSLSLQLNQHLLACL